jgi:glyoxylase-like metal-dependent hydrolase (beta-lactamase superfamily II)
LFSGDLVFTRGRIALLATPDTDPLQLAASIGRVAALEPDILLPGHGSFALTDAAAHLNEALAAFDLHRLPAGLV